MRSPTSSRHWTRSSEPPGTSVGTVGERGTVTTEAVTCPDGVAPVVDGGPDEATTLDIDRLQSPVPMAGLEPCLSGSGECERERER